MINQELYAVLLHVFAIVGVIALANVGEVLQ